MSFFRKYVFNNWHLKVLALLIAALMWFAIAREPLAEIVHTVPIEFVNVPEDLAINSERVPQVQIWLSGPERVVRDVQANDLHPVIDLSGAPHGGERTYTLSTSHIKAPGGIEIVQVIPTEFRLSFDLRESKIIDIKPRVVGALAPGYRLAGITSDPATITVVGPKARVDKIDNAMTDPIDASGVQGHQTFTTTAYVNDPLVRVMAPVPVHVTIATDRGQPTNHSGPADHNSAKATTK